MPRTRAYTRQELQSLRRADIQKLCKSNEIKGANGKTDTLIDLLLAHFASPAFTHSPAPSRVRPTRPLPAVASATATAVPAPRRAAPAPAPAARRVPLKAPKAPLRRVPAAPKVVVAAAPVAPAIPASELDVHAELAQLRETVARLDAEGSSAAQAAEQRFADAVRQKEAELGEREARLKAREAALDSAWEQIRSAMGERIDEIRQDVSLRKRAAVKPVSPPQPAATPSTRVRGSRPIKRSLPRSTPRSSAASEPPSKRARTAASSSDNPHTPSPHAPAVLPVTVQPPSGGSHDTLPPSSLPRPALPAATLVDPRTPSPSHQGTVPDYSMTPFPAPDPAALPSTPFGHGTLKRPTRPADLPLPHAPSFATTPRPSEPQSPTTDTPAHLRHVRGGGAAGEPPAMLTPGRPRRAPTPTPRKVSKAHMELTTITESGEARADSPTAGDAPTPRSILGPELAPARSHSPPPLSPSPSIGGDNFTYTPLPRPADRARAARSLTPSRLPGLPGLPGLAGPSSAASVVLAAAASSPARDYMDAALGGELQYQQQHGARSPSVITTPTQRTMLGTERYRDTRFGDEPVLGWATPTVDLGGTPRR